MAGSGLSLALLLFLLTLYAVNSWLNVSRYKTLSGTADVDRTAFYRAGLVKSLLLFLAGAMISLIVLHRLDGLAAVPEEFESETVRSVLFRVPAGWIYGIAAAWIAVICLASWLGGAQMKRLIERGDVLPKTALAALLPRTGGERFWAILISLNAGLSEELFFRLALPLLLAAVTGQAALAFWLAVVIFGLGHAYQGVFGVIATTIIGALLGLIYLYSGNLWLVVAIHAGIDLWSLVVMPLLIGWPPKLSGRQPT
ncbi:CPBP family intramembrane glutamic endopeptidase [Asticcacaulis solisilvae]|uniref:CPBP family intramembrane glutamic endopeptidase n=1 Tax=Asticcacaulis solisilvae TaxID=1217274 RepID=UPI003FD7C311